MKTKKLIAFKITVLAIILFPILICIIAGFSSDPFYFNLILPAILIDIIFVIQLILANDNIYSFIAEVNHDIGSVEHESLFLLPIPTVVLDSNKSVVWFNESFILKFSEADSVFGMDIDEIFESDININSTKPVTVSYEGKQYRVLCNNYCENSNILSVLCFQDITDFTNLSETYALTRPSVMLIMIDNYEDIMADTKESEKAHILVSIEKLFEDFISQTNGIIRRISNDKFIAVLEEQHIKPIIEQRFKILDYAREIKIDDRRCITLSIGVGHHASTLADSELFAKQALDMALGRGGDQAAVKNLNGFKFYGGISQGIEKQSRIKSRIIAAAMQELISNSTDVFIMGHRFGDLDSIGSAIGMAGAVRCMDKISYVVTDFDKNLAKPLINKLLSKSEQYIFMDVNEAISKFDEKSLLIIVDTHNKDIIESKMLYEKAKHIIVIDHHRKNVNFIDNAVIFHHEPCASSAAELVTELIQYFKLNRKLPSIYAEALLSGIMLDTKNYVMRTGVKTFEASAYLKRLGADTIAVKELFSSSMEVYKKRSQLIAAAQIHNGYAVSVAEKSDNDIRIAAPQTADELLNIIGVKASFVIYSINGIVNISARSTGNVNVQVIMEKLGGGGHQSMAATQMPSVSVSYAREKLIEVLDEFDMQKS